MGEQRCYERSCCSSKVQSVITASPKADGPPKPVKVLFAEDEVLLRLMVTDVLRQAGFQVFEASNGHEGVSILKTMPVDVVITDLPDRRMAQKSDFHAER